MERIMALAFGPRCVVRGCMGRAAGRRSGVERFRPGAITACRAARLFRRFDLFRRSQVGLGLLRPIAFPRNLPLVRFE
jgi:hypothetical protein